MIAVRDNNYIMSLIIVCGFHHKIEVGKDAKKKKYFFFKSFLKSKTLAVSKNPTNSRKFPRKFLRKLLRKFLRKFLRVSRKFLRVSRKFLRFTRRNFRGYTQGNLQFYIVRKKCVNFVPTKIEIKRIK